MHIGFWQSNFVSDDERTIARRRQPFPTVSFAVKTNIAVSMIKNAAPGEVAVEDEAR